MARTGRNATDSAQATYSGALKVALERAEREAVLVALSEAMGNVAEAAARLRIARPSIYRIMKRHGIPFPSRSQGCPMARGDDPRPQFLHVSRKRQDWRCADCVLTRVRGARTDRPDLARGVQNHE
jgi:hypothetical protein